MKSMDKNNHQMKTKLIPLLILLAAGIFACSDDPKVADPIYEFVSFVGAPSVNLNELDNSTEGVPVVAQLWAFKPYSEDIKLTLEVTGTNAEDGVDFTITPNNTITIPKGRLTSDTIWVKTIDNTSGSAVERSFELKIKSVSKNDIRIGLGIAAPENDKITFRILDNECSNTTEVFNTTLTNTIDWGGGDILMPATASLDGNQITVTGNLIDYGGFPGAALTITLTPDAPGSTKGTATFGEQYMGIADDGYEYNFIEVGTGSYDTCSGTISVEYDIYYMDGGWVYWYTVSNVYSVP